MRWLWILIMPVVILAATAAAIPAASAQSCQQLWVERNQYYKNRGYCFKTPRAISYFGNGGCFIQDQNAVPLTSAERTRIDEIMRQERAMGCTDGGGGSAGMTCQQLWVARNTIYKARRYCFKTPRAISHFGNGGCIYRNESDVPFSAAERAQIAQIRSQERAMGCQ